MKKYRLLIMACLFGTLTACVDDTTLEDQIGATPNLVGFVNANSNLSAVADGEEYIFELPVHVYGPNLEAASAEGSYTATISVDESSTAVAGTHFRLDETTVDITSSGNFLANFPITLLTDGIATPLASNPTLVLNVSSASGPGNTIASGSQLILTLLYLCPSDLSGDYSVYQEYLSDGTPQTPQNYTDHINQTGLGAYRTEEAGHWPAASLGGEPGFDFIDVCDAITIPSQNLVNLYSNIVAGVAGASEVDPMTGEIYFEYTVCASFCREYFTTYTPL